jgi:hypothetical protein
LSICSTAVNETLAEENLRKAHSSILFGDLRNQLIGNHDSTPKDLLSQVFQSFSKLRIRNVFHIILSNR